LDQRTAADDDSLSFAAFSAALISESTDCENAVPSEAHARFLRWVLTRNVVETFVSRL